MKALRSLILVFNVLTFFVEEFELRPVANGTLKEQKSCIHQMQYANRVRRSIPEFDAVNPASLDQDSLPDQDDPIDHQLEDVSQFSLADHVGNLFRSHKAEAVKVPPKPNDRPLEGDLSLNVAKEQNNALRSDEQYECYRQQNIEPPMMEEDPRGRRKWAKEQGPRAMPIMDIVQPRRAMPSLDVAQGPKISYVPFVRSEILKESGRRSEQKDNTQEVNSLYSNPVQQYNLKVVKQFPNKKGPSEYFILKDKKVPVPVNMHANFPIYDDDIDFDPDPLQGILDERYWFDPRENEPVMKMNIDEPIDERAPFNYVRQEKRSVPERSGKKKQYKECYKSSKEAQNSRNEVESCNECGKNGKKPNSTDSSDEGISYGRKLLSIEDDNSDDGMVAKLEDQNNYYESDGSEVQANPNTDYSYRSRKLLSFDYEQYSDSGVPSKDDESYVLENYSLNNLESHDLFNLTNYSYNLEDGYWHEYPDIDYDPAHKSEVHRPKYNGKEKQFFDTSSSRTDSFKLRKLLLYSSYDEDDESYNDMDRYLGENSELAYDHEVSDGKDPSESEFHYQIDYDQQAYETSSSKASVNGLQNQKLKNSISASESVNGIDENDKKIDDHIEMMQFDGHKSQFDFHEPKETIYNANLKHNNVYDTLKKSDDVSMNDFKQSNTNNENNMKHVNIQALKPGSLKNPKNVGQIMKISRNDRFESKLNDNLPKIYVSNKIGDILQKPQQEKPKGPRKNEQIDPSREFQIMRNETFKNASMGFTTASPNIRVGEKSLYKRGNSLQGPKNRRSFVDDSAIKSNPHLGEAHLFQDPLIPGGHGKREETTSSQTLTSNNSLNNENTSTQQNHTTTSPNTTSHSTKLAKNDDEESVDSRIANDIVESVIAESEKGSNHHSLGVCRRNESLVNIKFGKIIPETEKVMKFVTNCIMDKIKDHLAKQSCILLDEELIEFLKWLVLGGESYKEYEQKLGPKFFDFVPPTTAETTTCGAPTVPNCDIPGESLPPNPAIAQQALSVKDSVHPPKFSYE